MYCAGLKYNKGPATAEPLLINDDANGGDDASDGGDGESAVPIRYLP
jgi:hypothetical protein